ncbi:MAG: hypothetical protein SGILL_006459 [Bacillariaceae sp.]
MTDNEKSKDNNNTDPAQTVLKPLFGKDADDDDDKGLLSFAEGFRDKVQILFDHFDADGDGYLKYEELRKLQAATDEVVLSEEMYVMACKALNCHPKTGVSLEALKFTYASEGADIEKDFETVFGEEGEGKDTNKPKTKDDNGDVVYEVGADGVDISDN